jgi:hypothetical protein
LQALLKDICSCEIETEIAPGLRGFVSAARLCPIEIPYKNTKTAIGRVIDGEQEGASVYPNGVRYGDSFSHFPLQVLVGMANAVSLFAAEHWDSLRVKMTCNKEVISHAQG